MSKKPQYKEEAIALISYDPDSQKYVINDEALDFVNSVPGPIGVVGVAGMYRTGKSYLLNQMLLNRSNGFGVGPTVNPCTKGLWIWSKPLLGQTANGETIHILVIDSEGIGALDEDSTHDSRIFALTILLSSCFIYNSVGSIDENAIQNLSLVVNLTKNIQVRLSNNGEEDENGLGGGAGTDYEDFAQYFPNFIWVVRDFSLQLVDNDGEPISQKEYLERALAPQKGFSESVEQKNRIRRLLTTFFRERDCSTLVRPLTNEENLQNLDKMDFDKLRPEFFEQVITLRKRILSKMKEKTIKGKSLSGEMFADLIKSYATAINNGAIPNIESAWHYLCQNECNKAIGLAVETYDQVVKDVLHNKLPMPLEELKVYHRMAKDSAIEIFRKKAVGDGVAEEFQRELLKRVKQRFALIRQENEKESVRVSSNFIQSEFSAIERKLKMNEYKQYSDFETDLKLFYNYYLENGPKTVNRQVAILDFLQRAGSDGANFFLKQQAHETDIQRTLTSEFQKKVEQELKEAKDSAQREKTLARQKIAQIEQERTDAEIKHTVLAENVGQLKAEKEKLEATLMQTITQERGENQRVVQEMRAKLITAEETVKDLERNHILQTSEFDKERALLQQKVQYYEKALDEFNRKEKEGSNDQKNMKKDHLQQIRELTQKHDTVSKNLQQKINELQEKVTELESESVQREQAFDIERKKWEINEGSLTNLLEETNNTIMKLQRELDQARYSLDQNQTMAADSQETDRLSGRVKMLEDTLKQKEEQAAAQRSSAEKEKALLTQKLEFLELQNKEARQQLEENKRAHNAILKAFESSSSALDNKSDSKSLQEIKESHTRELKKLEQEFEAARKRLLQQNEVLTEKNNELEMKVRLEQADMGKKVEELQEQLILASDTAQRLAETNKVLEAERGKAATAAEERYSNRCKALEEELEEVKNRAQRESREYNTKSEQQLAQLKNIYEIERETLERRIAEEKEKWDKRLQVANEEYYQKIREDQIAYEDEIESLKEELREQEGSVNSALSQYEHELALKQQTIETLEKYIQETKESLANLQATNNSTLEQHINNFSVERRSLLDKIDLLSQEMTKKEKECLALAQKKESLEINLARREQAADQLKEEYQSDKRELVEKVEELKQKVQKITDDALEHKIESSKDIALSNQKNEFLNKKNEDLSRQIDSLTTRYEEKLKLLKHELNQEMQDKVEKLNEEKNQVDQKYEKAKKTLKEIEATYNKQLSQLEREKAICQEKLANVESKKAETELKLQTDNQSLMVQNAQLKETQAVEKKMLLGELDKYKQQNLSLEQDKNELGTNYDRDRALWEGKFTFLEQQKEQAKQDLVDALKKFELTLNHLQKARNNEKDEHENNLNELLISMEKKYQSQIAEMNENQQRVVQDYEDKLRHLNKELKTLKENNYMEKFGKIGNQILNEKKLAEFIENEKRLLSEIENLRAEREQRTAEQQAALDAEREAGKTRIAELEQKYKEVEQRRSALIFEHEKERAKWNLDKDHLMQQKNELADALEKIEKKKELLLRENEKMRNDQRVTRRSINLIGLQSQAAMNSAKGTGPNSGNAQQLQKSCSRNAQSPLNSQGPLSKKSSIAPQQQDNSKYIGQSELGGLGTGGLLDITNNYSGLYDPNKSTYQNYSNNGNYNGNMAGNNSNVSAFFKSPSHINSEEDRGVERQLKFQD